ncbi:T4SS efffector SepA family protein [Nostoc sp.]|uniref:T4SS efffector SepA family protein n=1 Tax=Nostoc sp. TaxID=1180 RepID=UPI002FFA3787
MPVIRIPDPIYKRLQAIAVPFEDTPITVIEKLLNEYEAHHQSQQISETENDRVIEPGVSNLQHTRVLRAIMGGEEIYQPNWNKILDAAHELAIRQGVSVDELMKLTLAHVVKGEKINSGFHYLPEVNISIQGVDSNLAWRNTLHLMKNLKMPIEIHFEWRDKEGAAHPGEKGLLIWEFK